MAKILYVTAVTGNYPDGQKINKALVTYDCALSADVAADCFAVENRTITGVQVENDTVALLLDNVREQAAGLVPKPKMPPRPKPKPGEKPSGPPRDMPPTVLLPVQVTVTQTAAIQAADGSEIVPDGVAHVSDRTVEPIVEEFVQGEFNGIPYNLYSPKNMEEGKQYPLVMFIHDAGPCGPDPKITLAQGHGAISFAAPEWQAEHPCFVLAPQIDRHVHLTNDDSTCSKELYDIKDMVDYIVANNPVDSKRVYATGQSMGCMASCEMNILFPDFFAASLLVAGQWSPERMAAKCTNCKLWILVSNHDAKAFPGMNAVTEAMEKAGAKIGRYVWDAKAAPEVLEAAVSDALKDDVGIRYTVFSGSSVVPEYKDDNPATNHVSTWPVAYEIKGLKRWLFSCQKEG